MAYYEQGYSHVRDDFRSGSSYVYRYLTSWYKAYDNNHTGLCIIKFVDSGTGGDGYERLIVIGSSPNNPFYIQSPSGRMYTNVTNWASSSVSGITNSSLYYYAVSNTNSSGEDDYPIPDYERSMLARRSEQVWSSSMYSDEPYRNFITTTLPIFTITENDYDKLNNYIRTGDDTGADNYRDLHPVTYQTSVWIDGTYPNLWYHTTLESGEGVMEAPTCLIRIFAIPLAVAQETYNANYVFDKMEFVGWGEYSNQSPIPIGTKTPYLITFTLDNDDDFKAQLNFYVDNNGAVSDISARSSDNELHVLDVKTGTPDDSDYPNDTNSINNTPPTHNLFSGANTLTKTYQLDTAKVKSLGNFLWSSTFKDNVLSLTSYPLENIIAIKALPLIVGDVDEEVKIGNVLTGIIGTVVSDADSIETTVGTLKIPRYFNNFIDFSEIDVMIYLPYIGFKKLDNLVAMNRELRVKYYFDCIMGNCLASIEFRDADSEWLLYDCYQGSCGIDVALTSTNRASIENGYINNALSTINNVASLNPVGIVKDVFNGATQDFHSNSTGVGNPSVMNALDTTCRVIIKRPKKYVPSEYGHIYGYPCYLYKKLNTLSGFTVCENFVCSEIGMATDGEKAEIKQLLESGIFIF